MGSTGLLARQLHLARDGPGSRAGRRGRSANSSIVGGHQSWMPANAAVLADDRRVPGEVGEQRRRAGPVRGRSGPARSARRPSTGRSCGARAPVVEVGVELGVLRGGQRPRSAESPTSSMSSAGRGCVPAEHEGLLDEAPLVGDDVDAPSAARRPRRSPRRGTGRCSSTTTSGGSRVERAVHRPAMRRALRRKRRQVDAAERIVVEVGAQQEPLHRDLDQLARAAGRRR